MKFRKTVTAVFSANALLAPMTVVGTLLSSTTAFAQNPPDVCYVIDIVCSRKDPGDCWVSEPQLDPDCDGEPG